MTKKRLQPNKCRKVSDLRQKDILYEFKGKQLVELPQLEEGDSDDPFDSADLRYHEYGTVDHANPVNHNSCQLDLMLEECLGILANASVFPKDKNPHVHAESKWHNGPIAFAEFLKYYKHLISNPKPSNLLILRTYILRAFEQLDADQTLINHATHTDNSARLLCLFAPFWIRPPSFWREKEGPLVQHLFEQYDAPAFLRKVWTHNQWEFCLDWICIYLIFARSIPVKKVASLFGWNLPAKVWRRFSDVPESIEFNSGVFLAEVFSHGGTIRDFQRLEQLAASEPLQDKQTDSYKTYREGTIRWLIRHGNQLDNAQCQAILAWAAHEFSEQEKQTEPWASYVFSKEKRIKTTSAKFSWKGRTVHSTLRHSQDYHRRLKHPTWYIQWKNHGWNWNPQTGPYQDWSCHELLNGKQLEEESATMQHCVVMYASRCYTGESAIFSLRHKGIPCITIELHPETKEITQAKGKYNRPLTVEEKDVLQAWKNEIVWGNHRVDKTCTE